jgi:hypothetical protein
MNCYKRTIEKAMILIPLLFSFSCSATQQARPVTFDIGPFDFEKRWDIYQKIDERANQLLKYPKSTVLKKKATRLSGKEYILELIDRTGDGKANEFAYVPKGGGRTQEFGFIFDLNHDGKIDYIVFNGGPVMIVDPVTKKFKKMMWMNYHWIDSNYDGKIDIMVFNDIDLESKGIVDEGITAWIYDTEFNGTVGQAEYLGRGFEQPVEKKDGCFTVKIYTGEKRVCGSDKDFFTDFNTILSDINSLLP